MPLYSIQAPNGQTYEIEGPEGATQDQVIAEILRRDPSAGQPTTPKGGLLGALGKGTESLLSSLQTAGSALLDPEAAAKAALQREEALSKKYAEQVSLDKLKKVYEEQGLLPAAKELAGQIPAAIAEQAPNIASTLGSARAGAALGSLAGPIGGVVGGVAGAALPTLISQFGSNIERQAAEQTAQGAPVDISRAAALGAAVPQAALDVAGTFIPLGGRLVSKLTGIPEKALSLGAGNAAKLAEERLATTLLKGTAVGAAAEIPTEIAQQMLERLQAGLPLTSQDAMAEYGQTAYQVGLLGPIGAAGRVSERGAARMEVQRQKDEEAAKAAQAAEAAKTAPEALRQLDTDYRTAEQQLRTLTEQLNAAKPKKGATDQEKAAYEQLKTARAQFITETYKPLRMEYTQRKGAIDQMFETWQAELEAGTAEQPTAKRVLPSDLPGAQPFQLSDTARLMHEYDNLRNQVGELETQLAAGPDVDTQTQLMGQRGQIMARMQEMGNVIEERGGVTETEADFTKRMKEVEKERLRLLTLGDFDGAAKQAEKLKALQTRAPLLQELKDFRSKAGQTRDLFTEMPEQPEAQGLQYVAYPKHKGAKNALPTTPTVPVQTVAATKEEATPLPEVKPAEQAAVQTAQTKLAEAEAALPAAVKAGNTEALYSALDQINQAQNTVSRAAEDVGRPALKPAVLDIFSPANLFNTAMQNGDTKLLSDIAKHADTTALRAALDKNTSEREKLVKTLEGRLDLEGEKRERADLFSQMYDSDERAKFTNGNNQEVIRRPRTETVEEYQRDKAGQIVKDAEGRPVVTRQYEKPVLDSAGRPVVDEIRLQDVYDKGGPAAVEYEKIMQQVEELAKKVTTKQGNAKESLYEQMVRTYAELEALNAQMESGIATPTMREKVAAAQAKLGKGEAPAERQMDASEKYQLQRKITATTKAYNMLVGKITPIRDQILNLHNSLYKTTKLEKPSVVAEKQKKEAEAAAKGPKAMTRTARTAARLARGDVRKEAETSEKMRNLARDLGLEEPEYEKLSNTLTKRYAALKAKYGASDAAVTQYQQKMAAQLNEKAMELGRKTPEYKATLKEQIAYFKEVLPTAGKQEVPTKRTGAVTRKQSGAPKRLVTSSPESRSLSTEEYQRLSRLKKDFDEAVASEKNPIAFRLREDKDGTVVDADEAQKHIDSLKLPENVKFVYAPTTGKIPVRLLNMMAKEGVDPTEGMVQGAVFPDGTVLVVGDQHANLKDLEETIAHELVGHYGIDTLIGIDRLNEYAKKTDVIKLAETLGGKRLVSEVLNTVRANADMGRSEEIQKLQALREIIAHTEEARVTESFREKAGRWLKELAGMARAALRSMGFKYLPELSNSDVFYMLKQARKAFANKQIGPYRAADGQTAFRLRRQPSDSVVGKEPGIVDKIMGNVMGLAGRVQFIDQYAALDAAIKKGMDAGVISSLEATNANYLLRFGQQRSQFAGQFLTNGPVKAEHTKKDGGVETIYRSTKGTSMMDVAQALHESQLGNDTEQENMFTVYLAGQRAKQVGWDKLNFSSPAKAEAEFKDVMAKLDADATAKAAFEKAAKLYQEYNAGLLDFLVDTGALSAKKAAELKSISYVPFYRINNNGEVQLMIDKEHPVRISNIKDEPQLKELIGGNTSILPVFTSAAQNTFMLTGMGLRNQAVKETAFTLKKLGIASAVRQGKGPASNDVVRFKKNGEDYYALIDTDMHGIPAHLIVRGMEGIKTTLPAVIKALGVPANILRSFVVRNPAYAVRQVVRDPLNAWLTTGTDATPVLSSMKELASMVAGRSDTERKLMETGAISSNIYSGDEQDMAKFLKDLAAGKGLWEKALARLDAFALQGDAATRAVIYRDSLDKGMTEQQALLRTLESMNFSRRGVSPSMQALSVMIPFFNAQVQGLDVLYRAFKGDMPYSKQLEIKEKLLKRGLMIAAGTLAYAAMMEDDEAYKRAKPEERYGNWFVYVPGVEEPVRVPIPFELGFLFKALPEAVYNMAANDEKAGKAVSGLFKLAQQTNPFSLPQAVKPLTEAVLGKSFYGGDIESAREKSELATDRYRESTTELSKMIGAVTGKAGVSPITLDYLIRGYTGPLGIALISLANPLLTPDTKAEIAQPTTKLSKTPFIGGLFQPVEGRGTLDEAYDRMLEIQQTKGTFDKLVSEGKRAEAQEFAQEYANRLAAASVSGSVQKRLGELAKMERQIRAAPRLTTEQKDAQLAQLDKAKVALARQFLAATDRTTRQ